MNLRAFIVYARRPMTIQDQAGIARRVLRLLRPHRRQVLVLVASMLVSALLGVAAPLLTKVIFDEALFPAHGGPRLGLLGALVGLTAGIVVLAGAVAIVQTYLATNVGQLVMHDLRDRLFSHMQRMSLRFFTDTRTGEIQSRISNDVSGLEGLVTRAAGSVVANLFFLVAALAGMAFLAWPLAVLSLAMLPGLGYLSYRVGRFSGRTALSAQEAVDEMSSIAHESLSVSGALLAKVFHRQHDAVERYRDHSRRLARLRVRQEIATRLVSGMGQAVFVMAPTLIYLGAGFAIEAGATGITAGTLVAYTALQIRLLAPASDLLDASMELHAARPLLHRIFQYLDLPQDIADSPAAQSLPAREVRGAVELHDVCFSYGGPAADGWTIDDVSLGIEPGQLAALVGPSGAGKTTITYLVARLYDADRGSVTIDGVDVRDIRLASLAEIVGMVTQEPYLFHATVRDNLLYASPQASPAQLEAAARLALIHDRITGLEDGYDTVVGERGYRMSGGEKQRLAIARAILRDPRVLILDEATSALDTESERLIQSALRDLIAQRTTIAIAHRLSTVLAADVIFVLDRGRVVERGTHAELLAQDGLYTRLYRRQFQDEEVEPRREDGVVLATGDAMSAPR